MARRKRLPHRPIDGIEVLGAAVILVPIVLVVGTILYLRSGGDDPASDPRRAFGPEEDEAAAGPIYEDEWTTFDGNRISEHSFPGEPWGADVLAEQEERQEWDEGGPLGWESVDELHGDYVNIHDGVRETLAVDDPETTIWFFGGSTAFGIGQRDEHTIASEIVRAARADGRRVEVLNFGVSAYVNWQATLRFEQALADRAPPDLAVFLDGVNDYALGYERQTYGRLDPSTTELLATSTSATEALEESIPDGYEPEYSNEVQEALAAAQYRRGVLRARELGEEYDVEVVNLWQPILLSMPVDRPMAATVLHNLDLDPGYQPTAEASYEATAEESGVDPVDLTDVFDDVEVPTFFDWAHTNEAGARIEAQAIYEQLAPLL
jgi:hypothetical protein